MRRYEIMFILRPDLKEENLNGEIDKIKENIKKLGGEILELNPWGRRRLAYPIKKFEEGVYYLGYFKLPEDAPLALNREWRLNDNILRTLVLKKGGEE